MSAWTQWMGAANGMGRGELWTVRAARRAEAAWRWVARRGAVARLQGKNRRLQVQETVQLGEKRLVAILRVDGEQFLIGSSAAGVQLLAALEPERAEGKFRSVLETAAREREGA